MSFRFPFPADPWVHREEDFTLARATTGGQGKTPGTRETLSATSSKNDILAGGLTASPGPIAKRNLAFADPIAFRYLEDDPTVTVVKRRETLVGYELYLVEQWACSRESPTLVIATYTGDEKHSIVVSVLGVPQEESAWSPRLRAYFKAIQKHHARPKETELGELMVTNLSSFPSAYSVIMVPDGDIRTHRQAFIVNENLKRLGCSGRSGMALADPTPATQAKFYQLYKTNDRIPFFESVIELVKLSQTSLFLFGKLELDYLDGLLCDKTEAAVSNWWTEVGSEYYNIEPTDGILGPTTVAALLGMLLGARNRLHYLGAPVTKDAFDIPFTKRGISWFQKTHKLERTRRLDRQTILKLHMVTAKAAAGEAWGVQKAVKSTVAEIGGKRGELVIGMVGGRDKGAIGDIETLDMQKFIDLTSGERAKWLWYGKPRRDKLLFDHNEKGPDMGAILFGGKEEAAAIAANDKAHSLPLEEEIQRTKEEPPVLTTPVPPPSAATVHEGTPIDRDRDALRKGVFKSVAGRVNDAKSGLGRIKDTIGGNRKGHGSRPSRDDFSSENGYSNHSISSLAQSSAAITSPTGIGRAFTWKNKPEEYLDAFTKDGALNKDASDLLGEREKVMQESQPADPKTAATDTNVSKPTTTETIKEEEDDDAPRPAVGSTMESDLIGPLATEQAENAAACYLQRRHSVDGTRPSLLPSMNDARWARRLSFSDVEDAVLSWEDLVDMTPDAVAPTDPVVALQESIATADYSKSLYMNITTVRSSASPWVVSKLSSVAALNDHFGREQDELQTLYYEMSQAAQHLKQGSSELVAAERGRVMEAIKEVEVLVARLEYEMNALAGKVNDVEDGVALFERQVEDVEARAVELKTTLEKEGWVHWLVRTLTGVGTGPNITRGEVEPRARS